MATLSAVTQCPTLFCLLVASIAQWWRGSLFATTEEKLRRFSCLVLYRADICPFVGAVTERLILASATGAPKIGLAGFNIHPKRGIRYSNSLTHLLFSYVENLNYGVLATEARLRLSSGEQAIVLPLTICAS